MSMTRSPSSTRPSPRSTPWPKRMRIRDRAAAALGPAVDRRLRWARTRSARRPARHRRSRSPTFPREVEAAVAPLVAVTRSTSSCESTWRLRGVPEASTRTDPSKRKPRRLAAHRPLDRASADGPPKRVARRPPRCAPPPSTRGACRRARTTKPASSYAVGALRRWRPAATSPGRTRWHSGGSASRRVCSAFHCSREDGRAPARPGRRAPAPSGCRARRTGTSGSRSPRPHRPNGARGPRRRSARTPDENSPLSIQ